MQDLTAGCRARGMGPKCARDWAAVTAPGCSDSEPNPSESAKAKARAGRHWKRPLKFSLHL